MIENDDDYDDILTRLSGKQKCAIMLFLLGEEAAVPIIQQLHPKEVEQLTASMFSVSHVGMSTVHAVLDEFVRIVKNQTSLGGGGSSDYIRSLLHKALGAEKSSSIMSQLKSTVSKKGLEILQWMDARSIAEMICGEHPQVIALMMSYLEYDVAADVLLLLAPDVRPEVIARVARLDIVTPDAINELERILQNQFDTNELVRSSSAGGVKCAAKIMNFAQEDMEQQIMSALMTVDEEMVEELRENMFVFDNLIMVDDKSLQTLLRSVDSDLLVVAMKGADDMLREKVYSCMSARAASNIQDELESRGPMRVVDVQVAQKSIISVARKMSDAGQIVLSGRGDDFV